MGARLRALGDVFVTALRLGLTSFGGPIAHIGYFRREYVDRRGWVDAPTFAELVALSQILPGPSSSQLGMAIGHLRAGAWGSVVAWLGFTLPSALVMALLASLWGWWSGSVLAIATHGLSLVAVAVVAQAVLQLYRSQCPTPTTGVVAWLAFTVFLVVPGPWTLGAVLVLGMTVGALTPQARASAPGVPWPFRRRWGLVALGVFGALALALPLARIADPHGVGAWADAFYRTGSWVFGGGHVVLPWLEQEVVAPGWVDSPTFLAAYGAAQALPGPLFTVSAFLGMVVGGPVGALVAVVAIFLPGYLLIEALLPFWSQLRSQRRWKGAFAGASATVVGLLGSTLVTSVGHTIGHPADWAVVVGLFLLLEGAKWPAWAVVLAGALVGPLVLLLG